MVGKTHLVIGLTTLAGVEVATGLVQPHPVRDIPVGPFLCIVVAIIGALVPDIDADESQIGYEMGEVGLALSNWLQSFGVEHRGLTHYGLTTLAVMASSALLGWWLGTLILSFYCTLLGQISSALVHRVNRSHMENTSREMMDRHHQSLNALRSGDKTAFKKINKLANEAYGKSLFLQLAMAGAYLWPVPFALGWLNMRFSDVGFPLLLVLRQPCLELAHPGIVRIDAFRLLQQLRVKLRFTHPICGLGKSNTPPRASRVGFDDLAIDPLHNFPGFGISI